MIKKGLTSIEMKFFGSTAGYNVLGHKRINTFWKLLKIKPFDEKLRRYISNWLRRVKRMKNNRMPKIMLIYRPNGRRRLGRHLKSLLDDAETDL